MDSWPRSYDVEQPKPIKVRARELRRQIAALKQQVSSTLISLPTEREAISTPVLTEAIDVLRTVAGEQKKTA